MQVFKEYRFNASMPFRELPVAIEHFLAENGLSYDSIFFECKCLERDKKTGLDKVLAKYPHFAAFANHEASPSWTSPLKGLADTDELLEDIREIMKKIPNPFNIDQYGFWFNNIAWLKEDNEPKMPLSAPWPEPGIDGSSYYSGIYIYRLSGVMQSGFMPVVVMIEVTPDDMASPLLDSLPLKEKLAERFGPCYYETLFFNFDEREISAFEEMNELAKPVIAEARSQFDQAVQGMCERMGATTMIPSGPPSITMTPAIKRKFVKEYGYLYEYIKNAKVCYLRKLFPAHNHLLTVDLVIAPMARNIQHHIEFQGHNFSYIFQSAAFFPRKQEDVEEFIDGLANILEVLVADYSPKINNIFGPSPSWWSESKIIAI